LSNYLAAHLDGFNGPLNVEIFKGGNQPDLQAAQPTASYVMRAKPTCQTVAFGVRAVEREYKVMRVCRESDARASNVFCLCEDGDWPGFM
jgi:aminoglycoside phosphotransferase (APT) family kinase protein